MAGLSLQNRTTGGGLRVGSHPTLCQWISDQISRSVVSDSLRPHESQHTRPPCRSIGLHTSMPTGSTGLPHQGYRAPAPADHSSSPMWTWPWNLPPSLDVEAFRATLDEPMPWRAPTRSPPHPERATWKGRVIKSL